MAKWHAGKGSEPSKPLLWALLLSLLTSPLMAHHWKDLQNDADNPAPTGPEQVKGDAPKAPTPTTPDSTNNDNGGEVPGAPGASGTPGAPGASGTPGAPGAS